MIRNILLSASLYEEWRRVCRIIGLSESFVNTGFSSGRKFNRVGAANVFVTLESSSMLVSHNSLDETKLSFVLNPKTEEILLLVLGFKISISFFSFKLGKKWGAYKEVYNNTS